MVVLEVEMLDGFHLPPEVSLRGSMGIFRVRLSLQIPSIGADSFMKFGGVDW